MSDFIKFARPGMAHEAIQSLIEAKRMARNLENFVDAIIPVLENEEAIKQLEEIREASARASHVLQRMYAKNAKEAFGGLRSSDASPRGGTSHNLGSPDATKANED